MMHKAFEGRIKVSVVTGCWEWQARMDRDGYARGSFAAWGSNATLAHRASYELHVGPIEHEMTVDHICFNTMCVNPGHLQILDRVENSKRQRSSFATHCTAGHLFDDANTYIKPGVRNGNRQCRKCNAAAVRRYQQRRREKGIAA